MLQICDVRHDCGLFRSDYVLLFSFLFIINHGVAKTG